MWDSLPGCPDDFLHEFDAEADIEKFLGSDLTDCDILCNSVSTKESTALVAELSNNSSSPSSDTPFACNAPASLLQLLGRDNSPSSSNPSAPPALSFSAAASMFKQQQQTSITPFVDGIGCATGVAPATSDTSATASPSTDRLMEIAAAAKLSSIIATAAAPKPATVPQSTLQSLLALCFATQPAPPQLAVPVADTNIFGKITMEDVDRLRELVRANSSSDVFGPKPTPADSAVMFTSRGRALRSTGINCQALEEVEVPMTTQEKNREAQRR